jgi:hypothetical protein
MTDDDLLPRDGVIAKIRNSASAQLWIVVAVAIAFILALRLLGYALTTFGLVSVFLIWIIVSACILWAKGRRETALRKKRLHDETFVDPEYDRGASMLLNRLEDDKRRAAEDRVRNRRA